MDENTLVYHSLISLMYCLFLSYSNNRMLSLWLPVSMRVATIAEIMYVFSWNIRKLYYSFKFRVCIFTISLLHARQLRKRVWPFIWLDLFIFILFSKCRYTRYKCVNYCRSAMSPWKSSSYIPTYKVISPCSYWYIALKCPMLFSLTFQMKCKNKE